MKNEIKNKPQTIDNKNDKKNKQDVVPPIRIEKISESRHTANVRPSDEPHPAAPAAVSYAQQPNAQQNVGFHLRGNRYIRGWAEGTPKRN